LQKSSAKKENPGGNRLFMSWTRHVFDNEVMIETVSYPRKMFVILDQKFVENQLTSLMLVSFPYQVRRQQASVDGEEY
jgi:hypothetical protein